MSATAAQAQPAKRGAWELWRNVPRALPYVRPYRKRAAASVCLTVLASVFALAEPWPLAIMLDYVTGHEPRAPFLLFGLSNRYAVLAAMVALGFFVTVTTHGLTVLNSYVDTRLEQGMILDLRSDLFQHCQRLSLTFHDARRTGELMSRVNYQAAALGAIVMAFPVIAQNVLTLIGMATVAILIDWKISLISLSAVPLIYYALGLYGTKVVPRLQVVQRLEWQSLSIVNEAMSMLRVIVSFGREPHEHQRFRTQGETAVDERVKLTVRQTAFTLGVQTATAFGSALVIGFGLAAVFSGDITIGSFIILLAYVRSIYAPLEAISGIFGNLNEHLVQLKASLDLLDLEPEVTEAPDAVSIGRARGVVEFENVEFAYRGRRSVLEDITFRVPAGSRVAIVGPTGAGKTTLVSLLARLYDPKRGRILIDGRDIRTLTLASLRDQISIVLQEPLLFSGTIVENIRYGKLDATAEEIVEAAKAANAHEFIKRLPQGYDTVVGEKGMGLSGGERQRIAVARAFIKDAPILILDEPTSSIDSKTEGVILDALEEVVKRRTSFMIAHRLSTIRDADFIVVLDQGRIVEKGTHAELMRLGGLYHQLHVAQRRRRKRPRTVRELMLARFEHAGVRADDDLSARLRQALESERPPAGDGDGA
jgi:ATP-binding cassette, subfamily B, bacterial